MTKNNKPAITLLDGGMGRELLRMGAPFRQPEWSALSLMEAPDLVQKAHELFGSAGSDILTTCNYAVVPFHLGDERFLEKGLTLTALAGQLARKAASRYGCQVAGSIPPLFGSYRPDLFSSNRAPDLLQRIINGLEPYVDIWLAETIGSIAEARIIAKSLPDDGRPFWISFSLQDKYLGAGEAPLLHSGETVSSAIQTAVELGGAAVLFNCCQAETMEAAVVAAKLELSRLMTDTPVGVYANAFAGVKDDVLANSTLHDLRLDLDPSGYREFVENWCEAGASIIGGCCGIGPEHIAALRQWLDQRAV